MKNDERFRNNIFHDFSHTRCKQKLSQLYGLVAYDQNRDISRFIEGKDVLDVGAGYGTLTKQLREDSFNVVGIEPNEEKIACVKQWYDIELQPLSIYNTGFSDNQFDCVILREVVFHLDFERALKEINRICKKQIIIFQGNSVLLRKIGQKIYRHKEFNEKDRLYYLNFLKQNNYNIEKLFFRDIIAFPLSGGWISRQMVPDWPWLYKTIIKFDKLLTAVCKFIRVEKWFCLRFLVSAKKTT